MSNDPRNEDRDPRREKDRKLGVYLRYSSVGVQFLVSILLCLWAGHWLDGVVGVSPLFLVLGALLGFAAGTYALVKQPYGRKTKSQAPDDEAGS